MIHKNNNKLKYTIYNNGERDVRVYDGDIPPEGFIKGSHYHKIAWNKGLTAKDDSRVALNTSNAHETRRQNGSYIAWNKGLTKETDSRITYGRFAELNSMYGQHPIAWNKGLTTETDKRMQKASENHKGVTAWNKGKTLPSHIVSAETREKIRQTHLDPSFKIRRYESMRKRGTLGINQDTRAELAVYEDLVRKYGQDDILHPYYEERYPYKCDFYIISEDKFIEVHGNWTHGFKPFNPHDPECQAQLAQWQEKAKTSKFYQNAIYTWTDLDVRKAEIAKRNNLNFEVIYYKHH